MLVAHLDTVHKKTASFICKSKNGVWMSPDGIGGDDRCGVELILSTLDTGRRPHVLFTHDEEVGGLGADAFVGENIRPELNFIVEFDRKDDNDAVFYDCDNLDFIDFVEKFGFKENYGSFSDISIIAPALGVAAVNLSSGYHNAHMCHEWVSIPEMNSIFERSTKLIDDHKTRFVYIEAIRKPYALKGAGPYYVSYDWESHDDAWDYFTLPDSKNETDFSKYDEPFGETQTEKISLMMLPDYGYVLFDGGYYDNTDGYYCVDRNGGVYTYDKDCMLKLRGAEAFDAYGGYVKFNEEHSFEFEGEIYILKTAS